MLQCDKVWQPDRDGINLLDGTLDLPRPGRLRKAANHGNSTQQGADQSVKRRIAITGALLNDAG